MNKQTDRQKGRRRAKSARSGSASRGVAEAVSEYGSVPSSSGGRATKLVSIGNSTGVIIPKELLARMRVGRGDIVTLSETPDGLAVRVYDPEFDAQMGVAETIMHEDRDILRKLAK